MLSDALGSWAMQFPQRMPLALAPSYRSAKHPWPSPRAESPQLMLENSTCFIPPVIAAIARARARWPQLGSNIRYCSVDFGCRLAHVTTLSALMCCTCPLPPFAYAECLMLRSPEIFRHLHLDRSRITSTRSTPRDRHAHLSAEVCSLPPPAPARYAQCPASR